MFLKNALVATVSVVALTASTFTYAQTDIDALYEAAKADLTARATTPTEYASACRKAAKKARV